MPRFTYPVTIKVEDEIVITADSAAEADAEMAERTADSDDSAEFLRQLLRDRGTPMSCEVEFEKQDEDEED